MAWSTHSPPSARTAGGTTRFPEEIAAGGLLGALVGLILGVLGQVEDPTSIAMVGSLLMGSLGAIRWIRTGWIRRDGRHLDT